MDTRLAWPARWDCSAARLIPWATDSRPPGVTRPARVKVKILITPVVISVFAVPALGGEISADNAITQLMFNSILLIKRGHLPIKHEKASKKPLRNNFLSGFFMGWIMGLEPPTYCLEE